MPTNRYELTYAGIPFVSDAMTPLEDVIPRLQEKDPAIEFIRKQQPLPELYDELNRIIPFCYLNDFKCPPRYPGRNLGAIAYVDEVGPQPSAGIRIGEWYYPVGATRWGVFRGLATSTMAKQMLAATQGRLAKQFIMKAVPLSPDNPNAIETDYKLISNMYMLPPRPMVEHGKCFDGLYLITLVDERYYWQNTPTSLRITKDTTWASLITQLSTLLGVTVNYSAISSAYATPEPDSQLWTNEESAAILLDAVARNIGRVVVRNLDGTYDLPTPTESQSDVIVNRGDVLKLVRMAGGDMFNSGTFLPIGNLFQAKNAVVPDQVRVSFPKYVKGNDPVPHMVNPRYQPQRPSCWYEESYGDAYVVEVPLASGGALSSGVSGQVNDFSIHTTAKALYSGEVQAASGVSPVNLSGIRSLARQIAEDYYGWQLGAALDEVYPGTYSWVMEGFHDVIWTYSERMRLASTRVLRSEWNQTVREMQHSAPALSGETNVPRGVGGPSVAQTWRDSGDHYANAVLNSGLISGGFLAAFDDVGGYPTQNRWRARINNEDMLMEGTSGGLLVGIVYRGIDGTIQTAHSKGDAITQIFPHTTYGVNLVTAEKMQWFFPGNWTSGGISEVVVVPQTQSVYLYSASGAQFNGGTVHYSGRVLSYDATTPALLPFAEEELIWIVERNGDPVLSGKRYDGQFAGFSQSGYVAPVYLINAAGSGAAGGGATVNSGSLYWYHFAACGLSGVNCSGWIPETFLMSGIVDNPLLDGDHHTDTVSGTPAKGYVIVGNSGNKWERFPVGNSGEVPIADPTQLFGIRWGAAPPSSGLGAHNLLDPTVHSDTISGAPARGVLIVGNSGTKWEIFPVGASGKSIISDPTQLLGIRWGDIVSSPSSGTSDSIVAPGIQFGRLSLYSGDPYGLTYQAAPPASGGAVLSGTSILYYVPGYGNAIGLFDNDDFLYKSRSFQQIEYTVSGDAYSNHDVFAFWSGSVQLQTLPWVSGQGEAAVLKHSGFGVFTRSGILAQRYIGSFHINASGYLNDLPNERHLWNMDNRTRKTLGTSLGASDWVYSGNTYRTLINSGVYYGLGSVSFITGYTDVDIANVGIVDGERITEIGLYISAFSLSGTTTAQIGIGVGSGTLSNIAVPDQVIIFSGGRQRLYSFARYIRAGFRSLHALHRSQSGGVLSWTTGESMGNFIGFHWC